MHIFNEAWPPSTLEEAPAIKVYSYQIGINSTHYSWRYVQKSILVKFSSTRNDVHIQWGVTTRPLEEALAIKVYSYQIGTYLVQYLWRYAQKSILVKFSSTRNYVHI